MDILVDDTNDLAIVNGDLLVGDATVQHIRHIVVAAPGEYKYAPLLGCAASENLNGKVDGSFRRTVRLQLESDGFRVRDIRSTTSTLAVDAYRP